MARVSFTDNLLKHLPCPPTNAAGKTVREVMDNVFEENTLLRSYLVDDQGRLRKHVNVFVNDEMVCDRTKLSDAVKPDDHIFVFQALSGG